MAQVALLAHPITEDDVASVAVAVATNIDYAFKVEWWPRWESDRPPRP